MDGDPLMENLGFSFCLEAARFLAVFRNSRQRPKGRRLNFDEKILAVSLLECSRKSYILLTILPLPSRRSLQSIVNTLLFMTSINTHVFRALQQCRKCLVEITIVISHLMKCQSERTYISITSLTALRILRIVKVQAGHATLQIML
jgi:hypothetical protein